MGRHIQGNKNNNAMKRSSLPRWIWLLPLLPLLLGLLLDQSESRLQHVLRLNLFDQYQRWYPRDYTPSPVSIIDIDEESLARVGQWPWPRSVMADLLEKLGANGAAVVGFDVMFSEPDRTSSKSSGAASTDHDRQLANRLAQTNAVVGFALERMLTPASSVKVPLVKANIRYSNEPQSRWLHSFATAIPSLPVIESAATGNGALTFVPEGDGIVRRVPLVLQVGNTPVPTLAGESLRLALGAKKVTLVGELPDAGLQSIRLDDLTIPVTPEGEVWVHYTQRTPARYVPVWQVLQNKLSPDRLAGHIVLVGSSAQGLMDLRFSPFGLIPGVEISAQVIEQTLLGHFIQRPTWTSGAELLALGIGSLVIGFLALRTRALAAAATCTFLVAGIFYGGWFAFTRHGILIDSASPAIGTIFSFVLCSLAHHFASERDQRWIKAAFSRYISPNRVAHLVEDPKAMELGGRRQECSFVFTDLANFTQLMEGMDPAQAVSLLNAYLDGMIAIAFRHEGTLDRIVGDAIAIMFSAPVQQTDHRQRALTCALEMDRFATGYANHLQEQGIAFGITRIGIHSGEVIVGNFGGTTMFDYRALGDPVNTASRLESLNKHLGTHVCVSGATLAGCPDAVVRPIGRIVLKGKTQAIEVFEPCNTPPDGNYLAAYDAMRNQCPEALQLFEQLANSNPTDPLVTLHRNRLAAGELGDTIVMIDK